ncbi:carbohydrate-binding protein [Motilibacter rhizosphaerae]|uniref:carbohydrate-binding protein n=1 Tax=Motilibacter rhizosphaerae TaxID=598652 RepID=UPI0013EEE5B5|nr:carbohydrate-binding protein [Motilibacter rhizosphaerae]
MPVLAAAALAATALGALPASARAGDAPADPADSAWTLSTTSTGSGYSPTFVGNGYLAARVPAEGTGWSTAPVATQAQVAGFYAKPADSVQIRASLPMWTSLGFSDGSATYGNLPAGAGCAYGQVCEAEAGELSGGATRASDHSGASGGAFAAGFGDQGHPVVGARTAVQVNDVPADGTATLTVRYANNDGGAGVRTRSLSVAVNGTRTGAVDLPPTDSWDSWATATVQVPVTKGTDAVALSCEAGDGCMVNVDYVALTAGGSPALPPGNGTTSDYRQTLDLRTGVLTTTLTWTSPAGRVTDLRYDVLADRAQAHVGAVRLTVHPHWSGTATATDALDGRAANAVTVSGSGVDAPAGRLAETVTADGTGLVAGLVSTLQAQDATTATASVGDLPAQSSAQRTTLAVEDGSTYTLTKYVGLATSVDTDRTDGLAPLEAATRASSGAAATGWDDLLAAHEDAWAQLWSSDISVPGDDALTLQARASMFYLLESTRAGVDWSTSPGGLSSDGYSGHVFWDMETWMFPSLLAQHPDIAAGADAYRQRLLPGAQAYAQQTGWKGARFPWESALAGDEQTPTWADTGKYEIHVTADVALAQWQYYEATGDEEWLRSKAWPVLAGAADFWASRVTPNAGGGYSIKDVIPPDEYAVGVDDDVYTNVAAATTLRIATQAAQIIGATADPRWSSIAAGIVVPYDRSLGIHPEYAGYSGQTIKQADAVMLQYPWGYSQPSSVAQADLDYYVGRTDLGGPSMTDAIHAIDTAELGTPGCSSWTFLQRSVNPFMRAPFDQFSETRGGGAFTFTTGAGGFLQEFLYGFTGLRWDTAAVQLDPVLPPQLPGLDLTGLAWQGRRFDLSVGPRTTTVTLRSGDPLPVQVAGGAAQTVAVGGTLDIPTRRPDLTPTSDEARCAAVSASSSDASFPAVGAVDGSAATQWRPTTDGASLTVDLGAATTVRRVRVVSGSGGTTAYTVAVSLDGSTWSDLGSVGAGADPTSSVVVSPTQARYVRYTAAAGTTPQVASLEATDTSPPDAPTGVTGVAGDGQVTLSWTAPSYDGAQPVDHYVITPYVDGVAQTPVTTKDAATSSVVTGLTNGTAYTFTVAAHTSVGDGVPSARSAPVQPRISLQRVDSGLDALVASGHVTPSAARELRRLLAPAIAADAAGDVAGTLQRLQAVRAYLDTAAPAKVDDTASALLQDELAQWLHQPAGLAALLHEIGALTRSGDIVPSTARLLQDRVTAAQDAEAAGDAVRERAQLDGLRGDVLGAKPSRVTALARQALLALIDPLLAQTIEAEDATLGGGACTADDHSGHSGSGFAACFTRVGASVAFTVDVPSAGTYDLALRYANGTGAEQTATLTLDGTQGQQVRLAPTAGWDTWGLHTTTVRLHAGANTVAYAYGPADSGNVNLDDLTVQPHAAG